MMAESFKKKKGIILALAAIGIIAAALLLCYYQFRPQSVAGQKTITVDVVYEDASVESFEIHTDAQYLEQALGDEDGLTVQGTRSEQFGLMIETVNGVTAIYDRNQAYWSIEVDGSPCNYGISSQPVQDQEHYQLVYTAAGTP